MTDTIPIYDIETNAGETYQRAFLFGTKVDAVQWSASASVATGAVLRAVRPTGFFYLVTIAGTLGTSEPAWPTVAGASVVSGSATLVCQRASYVPIDFTGCTAELIIRTAKNAPPSLSLDETAGLALGSDGTIALTITAAQTRAAAASKPLTGSYHLAVVSADGTTRRYYLTGAAVVRQTNAP